MGVRLAVDVGCTTVVAAAQDSADGTARLLGFEGEDGPAGTLVASLTWSAGGLTRVGIEADRMLDADPHGGVRGPLAHMDSGSSTLELAPGPVPVVALIAELLTRPLRVAARELGAMPEQAVLAIPAGWAADGRRARALRAAAALAGLPPVALMAAAIAAAEHVREEASEVLLVCDVGGRSAQLSLVDLREGAGRLLATTELVVGADLFDELLYHEIVRELADDHPGAARRLEDMHLQAGGTEGDREAARWGACQAGLARAVRHCREALAAAETQAVVIGDPVGVTLEVGAQRVCDLLQTECQILAGAAREQLAQAGLGGPRVDAVLVGGGAVTPGLRATLEAELDLPVVIAADPVTVVARGALAATRLATAEPAGRPARRAAAPPRPAPVRQRLRTLLEEVVAAAMSGDEVVAVVRHDAHHRVVRIDLSGRVHGAHGVAGAQITSLAVTPASVVVSGDAGAAVLSADLRPLTTIERPLVAGASGTSVWVLSTGDEQAPVLSITTLAVEGRAARIVDVGRVGLAPAVQAGRLARRPGRPGPPGAFGIVSGARLHFAVPARGRGGSAAQRVGEAGPSGLGAVQMRTGPDWLTALAPAPAGGVLVVSGAAQALLRLGDAQLASWPAGVGVALAAAATGPPWVLAARRARWELLRLDGEDIASVRSGDGAVEAIEPDADGLWLVCESGGERRLIRVGAAGELERLAALNAPMAPIGRSGAEILVLAGPTGAPRTLVAITPD